MVYNQVWRKVMESLIYIWDKVFRSVLSKFRGRQLLQNLLSPFLHTLSHMHQYVILRIFIRVISRLLFILCTSFSVHVVIDLIATTMQNTLMKGFFSLTVLIK